MTHSAGFVTTQSIAFKFVMAFEPYRYTRYLKQVMAGVPYIEIYFFLNTYSIESNMILKVALISLNHNKILGRYAQNWIFQYFFSKSVHGYLTTR
jgi:hypothetical protein